VRQDEQESPYIYYVKRNFVIDALNDKKAMARYANDARGLQRVKDINNNCEYVEDGVRVFIEAAKDIPAGGEIFVSYGPEYWQVIRHNMRIDEKEKKKLLTSGVKVNGKASKVNGKASKVNGKKINGRATKVNVKATKVNGVNGKAAKVNGKTINGKAAPKNGKALKVNVSGKKVKATTTRRSLAKA
jgi:SET domain-containing protein